MKVDNWIKYKNKLPEPNTMVIVNIKSISMSGFKNHSVSVLISDDRGYLHCTSDSLKVSHWMQLPKPVKD